MCAFLSTNHNTDQLPKLMGEFICFFCRGEVQKQLQSRSSGCAHQNAAAAHLVISVFWNKMVCSHRQPANITHCGLAWFLTAQQSTDSNLLHSCIIINASCSWLDGHTAQLAVISLFFWLKNVDNRVSFCQLVLQGWSELTDATAESNSVLYPKLFEVVVEAVIHQVLGV